MVFARVDGQADGQDRTWNHADRVGGVQSIVIEWSGEGVPAALLTIRISTDSGPSVTPQRARSSPRPRRARGGDSTGWREEFQRNVVRVAERQHRAIRCIN